MRIIILGPSYPFRGGIAAFNDRLAIALRDAGHEVKVITFSLQYPSFLFPGKTQYSEGPAPSDIHIDKSVNSINPFNWIKIGSKIKNMNADLVISRFWLPFMGPCLGTILRFARKNRKTKVISIIDNIIPHESRPGDKVFSKYFLNANDGFITMTESVHLDLLRFDNKKSRIISPHPLYDHYGDLLDKKNSLKQLNLDSNNKYMLFFGLIRDYKGLDLLLKAMPSISPDIHLIIAGEYYSEKEVYTKQIHDLDLQDRVHQSEGFIPDEKVNLYFSACDIVVQPYKTATQSGVTQIAYHFEKPMIVTNVGGLSEMCPNNQVGFVSEPNAIDISNKISDFYSDNIERFSDGIKSKKQEYEWPRFVKNIIGLYRDL